MFKKYWGFIPFLFVIVAFVASPEIGSVIGFLVLIWYNYSRNELRNEVNELEADSCKLLKKTIDNISSINYDILEGLTFFDIERQKTTIKETLLLMDAVLEQQRQVLTNAHRIHYLTKNSGWLFVKSYNYSYISHCYTQIECFDLYSFYQKYKDKSNEEINIDNYREDYIYLLSKYRLDY